MVYKKTVFFLFAAFILAVSLIGDTGCANIVPPEGGLRDTLPPVLLKASVPNGTRNFSADRVTFSFDEYVDLDNYQQYLIVSPLPTNSPTVTRKLNTITVKLRDSLEPNTTYSLNFGRSIKDINEGNVMKDFTYVVSTGRYIDSLELSGRVLLAETGESDSTLTVMLHREKDDSALINQRPRYIAKTNGTGRFHFRNLPAGTFYIYALKDEGSYRYMSKSQLFAFSNDSVVTGRQTDSLTLYAYAGEDAPARPSASTGSRSKPDKDKRLKFVTNLNAGKQGLLDKLVFTFENPLRSFDSSKVRFATDTTFTPVTGYTWTMDSTRKKMTLTYDWKENALYHLMLEKDFATDTLGQQLLKPDTISFRTKARAEYGKLTIRFRNFDPAKNQVLLFVRDKQVVHSFPLEGASFSLPLFEPGEYNLRILEDANKNGEWDPGEFFGKRKQPEIVKPISRKLTVKPNWENNFDIALPN